MDASPISNVIFDYTHFLGEHSNHHWTFRELFKLDGLWTNVKKKQSAEEKLWQEAMSKLSAQHSDEENILALVYLAKQLGFTSLSLKMPYDLPKFQCEWIEQQAHVRLIKQKNDEFLIHIH